MTLIVSATTGAVVGSLVFPYRRYRFWRKWSRRIFVFALVVIVVINALFGLLGLVVAHGISWKPWHEAWRNGISFGLLGLALVRIRLPGTDIDTPEGSIHALKATMHWTVGWLDDFADDTIRRTLAHLDDHELRELVSYILNRYVIPDPKLDSQDRASETLKMAKADDRLVAGDRNAWPEMLAWCVLQTRRRLLVIDRLG